MRRNQGNGLVLLLGVVAVLLVAASAIAGYLYFQNQKLQAKPISAPTITPSPTPPDETAGWKTFADPHGLFRLKYPPNLLKEEAKIVVPNGPGAQQPSVEQQNRFSGVLYNTVPNGNMNQPGELHISFYNYRANQSPTESVKDFVFRTTHYSFGTLEEVPIDGRKSYFSRSVVWGGGGVGNLGAWIPQGNGTYILALVDAYEGSLVQGISEEHVSLFKQILSTFKFLDSANESDNTTSPKTALTYSLPAGWKTAQDKTGTIEVGYDPSINHPATEQISDLFVVIMPNDGGSYRYIVGLKPYNGGSRHKFIWSSDQPDYKYPNYQEKEYSYNGWSCLVLYGAIISQGPDTNGMCAVTSSQAFYIGYRGVDTSSVEKVIRTIKLLK